MAILGRRYHLSRLRKSARDLAIGSLPPSKLIIKTLETALESFDSYKRSDGWVRIVLYEHAWTLEIEPWEAAFDPRAGIKLASCPIERPWPEHKHCSALPSVMARKHAAHRGADEALLVDRYGIAREGAWSNFFWVGRNGRIKTAPGGVLPGVTRRFVLDHFPVELEEAELSVILRDAEEAFVTQASHGIVPVRQIDGRKLKLGRYARRARRIYESAFRGNAPGWLETY